MIRKYLTGDVYLLDVQHEQEAEVEENAAGFEQIEAFTLIDDAGRVQAVFGYQETAKGVCDVYALLGKSCGRFMIELVRSMPKILHQAMRRYGWRRAQATIKKDFAAGKRFIVMLGFSYSGELPQFYGGNDYLLYEKEEQ